MAKKQEAEISKVEAENKMYEAMLLLKPDILESALKKKLKDFKEYLEEHKCKITEEDIWQKRRLAYKIKQYEEAIYVVYNFESPTDFIKELENHLRIDKDVMRHLIVTLDMNYIYTKFYEQADVKEDSKPKKDSEKKPKEIKSIPVKKIESDKEVKSEELKEEKKEEKEVVSKLPKKKEEAVKEEKETINKNDLDDKLDKLLGGDDLNI